MYGVAGQKRVPQAFVENFEVNLPPLRWQHHAADFLDRETSRIDALISQKRRLSNLMEERRVATATDLVTGWSSNGPLQASGTPLIPECPVTWQVVELRRLECEVQTGPFGSQLHADEYVSDGHPVVNPSNLIDGRIEPDWSICIDDETHLRLKRHALEPGDVVFGRRGELGRAGLVTEREAGWICGTGCLRIRFQRKAFESRFLRHYLRLPLVRQYFESVAVGSTMGNLNSSIVLGLPVPIPPLREQVKLADAVDQVEDRCLHLMKRLKRQISLLEERRQALITAAVTGELEVRKAS